MNRTLPLILTAALLLTACASAAPAQPSTATASPSASPLTPETSSPQSFPVGHLVTLPQNQNSGPVWNTGDALYELRDASSMTPEALILRTDYATLTQSVYCDLPGCTHDSDACPAYLASGFCVGVMAVDGTVYTYPSELTDVAPTQIYRIDPATGAREKICTRPYMDGYFHNYYDGRIYYTGSFRNADTPSQQASLLYFDTADGTEKTLLETIPLDTYGIDVTAPFSPAFVGVPQRYLRVLNAGDAYADYLLDMETGDVLSAPTVTAEGVRRPALLLACTATGQWLTASNPRDSYDPEYSLYALWDPEDLLADG